MIQRHLPKDSFIDPAGLSMLGGVFDEICRQRQIEAESEAAFALAKQLLSLYNEGIHDRAKLLAMAGHPGQDLFAGAT
ncbi:hypothetical protein OCK02_19495 [Rhizobium sp. TRM96647]|uniref:hypothetical protein n=1 Tax=unclassified Rhizobium TaxID=2613769 RepID=UPI0021E719AD|nr:MULTISPECIES: hypothetical protein [unclassified Rhizobium]MCV3738395.1 hypothetical protein [Rhizobium sp. TRM96647]MCV3759856.1 hypothetical protein [Rhizobium sp. TRM96650]